MHRQGLKNFLHKPFDFEWFGKHRSQALFGSLYDAVIRIITKSGHQYDRRIVANFLRCGKNFIAIAVGHANIGNNQIITGLAGKMGQCFRAVGGGVDMAAAIGQHVMNRLTDIGLIIRHENALSLQAGILARKSPLVMSAKYLLRTGA